MRHNSHDLLLASPQPLPRRHTAPRQSVLGELIQPRLRRVKRIQLRPVKGWPFLCQACGVRTSVAGFCGVFLEFGEGEGGAALGDAPPESVGGGLEGAAHGAGDDQVDFEGELF
ncbi:hypothetical protein O988_06857 [Pseudogymnoascus sp. VKM F-3808]|nr:hypothetical protein O988_06857 [Pseudogymnoascus sp. VKM F-3808]